MKFVTILLVKEHHIETKVCIKKTLKPIETYITIRQLRFFTRIAGYTRQFVNSQADIDGFKAMVKLDIPNRLLRNKKPTNGEQFDFYKKASFFNPTLHPSGEDSFPRYRS